jgi:hypothetical protein
MSVRLSTETYRRRYYQGVARRGEDLVCTCGHSGHLHQREALDCVTAMVRGLRLVIAE